MEISAKNHSKIQWNINAIRGKYYIHWKIVLLLHNL